MIAHILTFTSDDGVDFLGQSVNLTFVNGSTGECHSVPILHDDECEPTPETFSANLAFVSGIPTITIHPASTEVFIDDSNETECG